MYKTKFIAAPEMSELRRSQIRTVRQYGGNASLLRDSYDGYRNTRCTRVTMTTRIFVRTRLNKKKGYERNIFLKLMN